MGLVLLLVPGPLFPFGWVLIIARPGRRAAGAAGEGAPRSLPGQLLGVLWQVGTAAAALALLLTPAALVWAMAQAGGPLVSMMAEHAGSTVGTRPAGFWLGVGGAAAGVGGVWWIVVGAVLLAFAGRVRAALGPALSVVSPRGGPQARRDWRGGRRTGVSALVRLTGIDCARRLTEPIRA